MGLLSILKTLSDDVNDAADSLGRSTVVDYGEPAYTLYTALRLGDMHRRIDVTDEQENVKYYTKSSIIAVKGKTDIMDADGNLVANLEKRPISVHEIHYVTMADGTKFTLSNELFHVAEDITNIAELGWQIRGNLLGLSFNLVDGNEEPLATVGKKAISMHDKYYIDIYQPDYEDMIVAVVIQLEKMLEARRENESSSGISFSSNNG